MNTYKDEILLSMAQNGAGEPLFFTESDSQVATYPLISGVTKRFGGVSIAPYDEMNLALHVGDKESSVVTNRTMLATYMGITLDDTVWAEQTHGLRAVRVTADMKGKGATSYQTAIAECDALYTNEKNIGLMICIADCCPVMIYDPVHHAVGTVHAGWRGVIGELPRRTLECMVRDFDTNPQDCYVYVGPGIGPESFEVSPELAATFANTFGEEVATVRQQEDTQAMASFVDLPKCILKSMLSVGVCENYITLSPTDTYQDESCYSYRREQEVTGRMALFACLK